MLHKLLMIIAGNGINDLHLSVGALPAVRKNGEVLFLDQLTPITMADMDSIITQVVKPEMLAELNRKNHLAFAYSIAGKGRYRVIAYRQRGTYAITFRASNFTVPNKAKLRLPDETDGIFALESGLVLVTGTKNSGVTTTCSYILDRMRTTRRCHIVTIENPIEYLYSYDKSIVSQMDVGLDVEDMKTGIDIAIKDNADVIYLSEMIDTETIRLALEAARSGKLVISTMDIFGASDVIRNIIDVFPSESSNYIRTLLSQSLKCIVSQQLITDREGGLVPLCEIVYGIKAVANLIRENKILQIDKVIASSETTNMLSKDNHLVRLFKNNLISSDTLKDLADDWNSVSILVSKTGSRTHS
jgi:twitching motility protein PilT